MGVVGSASVDWLCLAASAGAGCAGGGETAVAIDDARREWCEVVDGGDNLKTPVARLKKRREIGAAHDTVSRVEDLRHRALGLNVVRAASTTVRRTSVSGFRPQPVRSGSRPNGLQARAQAAWQVTSRRSTCRPNHVGRAWLSEQLARCAHGYENHVGKHLCARKQLANSDNENVGSDIARVTFKWSGLKHSAVSKAGALYAPMLKGSSAGVRAQVSKRWGACRRRVNSRLVAKLKVRNISWPALAQIKDHQKREQSEKNFPLAITQGRDLPSAHPDSGCELLLTTKKSEENFENMGLDYGNHVAYARPGPLKNYFVPSFPNEVDNTCKSKPLCFVVNNRSVAVFFNPFGCTKKSCGSAGHAKPITNFRPNRLREVTIEKEVLA
ncbi:hypothetical protein C2S52_016946 [Perilla frutescens var. hirtella]|nr:hypothetical protein C2S52_016946 [Perilla frutescens var. hirtella]